MPHAALLCPGLGRGRDGVVPDEVHERRERHGLHVAVARGLTVPGWHAQQRRLTVVEILADLVVSRRHAHDLAGLAGDGRQSRQQEHKRQQQQVLLHLVSSVATMTFP